MPILERKIVYLLLLLICVVAKVKAGESAITLPELRQIATESRESITTGHFVFIEEFNDNRPIDNDVNSIEYKLKKFHNHRRLKANVILNNKTKSLKSLLTDSRDMDVLLKEYNLSPKYKETISQWTRSLLIQPSYEMELPGTNVKDIPLDLILSKRTQEEHYRFSLIHLGIINEKLLTEDYGPILSEINSGSKSLLRIELNQSGQNLIKTTIDCDPSLEYRFCRMQRHRDGQLINETIAEDYRDVKDANGVVPYPFLYIERSFGEDGRISVETKYMMEKIELGVDVSPDDFKIFVPAGTHMLDSVVTMTVHTIEKDGYMGIDDALAIVTSWSEKHKRHITQQ